MPEIRSHGGNHPHCAGVSESGEKLSEQEPIPLAYVRNREQLLELINNLAAAPPPDPVALASTVRAKLHDKYDRYLSDDLLNLAYAARALDIPGAWACLAELSSLPVPMDGDAEPTTR